MQAWLWSRPSETGRATARACSIGCAHSPKTSTGACSRVRAWRGLCIMLAICARKQPLTRLHHIQPAALTILAAAAKKHCRGHRRARRNSGHRSRPGAEHEGLGCANEGRQSVHSFRHRAVRESRGLSSKRWRCCADGPPPMPLAGGAAAGLCAVFVSRRSP
jgi:hypothetical protein